MKNHPTAGLAPAQLLHSGASTDQDNIRRNGSDARSLDQDDLAMRAFIATKSKQLRCSPIEVRSHLLDPCSIRQPHAEHSGALQSFVLDLQAAQIEKVARPPLGGPGAARTNKQAVEPWLRQCFLAMITAHGDPFVAPSSLSLEGGLS